MWKIFYYFKRRINHYDYFNNDSKIFFVKVDKFSQEYSETIFFQYALKV